MGCPKACPLVCICVKRRLRLACKDEGSNEPGHLYSLVRDSSARTYKSLEEDEG